jgi:inosine-uridine nucleoside N-ribohydrolase
MLLEPRLTQRVAEIVLMGGRVRRWERIPSELERLEGG